MRTGRVAGLVVVLGLLLGLMGGTAGGRATGAGTAAVLWEQAVQGTAGVVSTYYTNRSLGAYAADDFVVDGAIWELEMIFVDGFVPDGNLEGDATALAWYLYADTDGVPDAHPGYGAEVWSYITTPADPAVTFVNHNPQLDVVSALGTPVKLRPGNYWLVFFPSMEVTNPDQSDRFNWHIGATGNAGWCAEYDEGIFGGFAWTDIASLFSQPGWHDLAFRLEGTARPLHFLHLPAVYKHN